MVLEESAVDQTGFKRGVASGNQSSSIMKASVLVTGAAGFIGSHVCDALIKAGWRVVGLDDLSGGFRDNVGPDITFVEGSINDAALVDRLFEQHQFEYVFHLAAYAAEG